VPHREFLRLHREVPGRRQRKLLIPADLKTGTNEKKIQALAVESLPHAWNFREWGPRGFLSSKKKGGKLFLNEVNTIPGFTSISMYPKIVGKPSGISFRELIDKTD